mmetsp:Transcript_30118/g.90208  ORF Transcript_30118/g.90208 Transcript_30118/m.90208 type:complete len:637 (+) Transcript_30118:26-1936(+)
MARIVTDFRQAVSKVAAAAAAAAAPDATREPIGSSPLAASERHWAEACAAVCTSLRRFPTGCTRSVLVSEVAAKLQSDRMRASGSVAKVVESGRVGRVDEVVDVHVLCAETVQLDGASAVVLTLADAAVCGHEAGKAQPTLDAYLHTRFENLVGSPLLPTETSDATDWPRLRIAGFTTVRHPGGGMRALPTEYAAFILEPAEADDGQHPPALAFVLDNFSTDSLSTDIHPGSSVLLLARVVDVGLARRVRHPDHTDRLVISVEDCDGTPASRRDFVLYDDQVAIAKLIQRGDVMALAHPHIPDDVDDHGRFRLEYGGDCTIFLLPGALMTDRAMQQLSQAVSPRRGPSRRDVTPQAHRECLVGTVVAVSGNIAVRASDGSGDFRDRLYLTVDDGAEEVTVTLVGGWGPASRTGLGGCHLLINGARVRTGQLVVLDGLKYTGSNGGGGRELVGDANFGATLHCPSALGAGLHLVKDNCQLLWDGLCEGGRFIANSAITHVSPLDPDGSYVTAVHSDCHWPAVNRSGRWCCAFCDMTGVTVEQAFRLCVTLDDGSAAVMAEASGDTIAPLLPVSPSDFAGLSPEEQKAVLDRLLCREVVVDLCCFWSDSEERHYRVDAMKVANAARGCREEQRIKRTV